MKGTIYPDKRNNSGRFLLIIVIISLLCIGYNADAQQKAAFVVGNNDYKETPLKNAVNDANLMEATLKRLGFTVQKVLNASKADFERQMLAFNRNYANADIRFFYYAGHGYQMEGENYLVPVDATGGNKADVILECLNFSTIFSAFQHSNPQAMHIFVMDACRNNPFKNLDLDGRGNVTRGLILRKADFITGSYAAFAADNGQFASDGGNTTNGLYTKVLAEEMLTPGVEINILFQKVRSRVRDLSGGNQTPVEENRLIGDKGFYFIQQAENPAPAPTTPPIVVAKTYYYYIDQTDNESQNRFDDRKAAESEMRSRKLFGRIYSNAGEVFVVDKPAEPVTTTAQPTEMFTPAVPTEPAPSPAPATVVTAEKYYYYTDQNGNESTNRFDDRKAAESEMRSRKLYGKIYSNAGEVFIVDKPAEPVTLITNDPAVLVEKGFVSIFNGKDLTGWKGLVANPIQRAKMKPADLRSDQAKADEVMRNGWTVVNGELVFNGKGDNICTEKLYGDFELFVDWKLDPAGSEPDAGIYLRGTPQVQIWGKSRRAQVGSGGLYNNQTHPSNPLKVADNKLGEWNTFYIKMIGDRVTVILNGELVVDNTILENYWDRSQPIPPVEQIELQASGSKVYYRNIYIKEL